MQVSGGLKQDGSGEYILFRRNEECIVSYMRHSYMSHSQTTLLQISNCNIGPQL